ncbi:hypothetical protein NE857_13685 [Nocardiopsis exhalans]|uniref:Uncharacterized protein n=1 Tax=Nocardiopsis exhalans TaxID=163604 RepID=A0ABY5DHS7_9ACTN|nr:hypothetical protein [Nocardiopsis exhalans]USY22565.1 hypothetical protein NE857_13685 [Nocardiopsis exhalans]
MPTPSVLAAHKCDLMRPNCPDQGGHTREAWRGSRGEVRREPLPGRARSEQVPSGPDTGAVTVLVLAAGVALVPGGTLAVAFLLGTVLRGLDRDAPLEPVREAEAGQHGQRRLRAHLDRARGLGYRGSGFDVGGEVGQ